jgi:hypothetical protein
METLDSLLQPLIEGTKAFTHSDWKATAALQLIVIIGLLLLMTLARKSREQAPRFAAALLVGASTTGILVGLFGFALAYARYRDEELNFSSRSSYGTTFGFGVLTILIACAGLSIALHPRGDERE